MRVITPTTTANNKGLRKTGLCLAEFQRWPDLRKHSRNRQIGYRKTYLGEDLWLMMNEEKGSYTPLTTKHHHNLIREKERNEKEVMMKTFCAQVKPPRSKCFIITPICKLPTSLIHPKTKPHDSDLPIFKKKTKIYY